MYLYDHRFQGKYIFVVYSQVYKSTPLQQQQQQQQGKKKVDHSLVDICYYVSLFETESPT